MGYVIIEPKLVISDAYLHMKEKLIKKGEPIIIPNAAELTPEELKKAKHAEKIRRYRERKVHGGALQKTTKSEVRAMSTSELVEMSKDVRNKAVKLLDKKLSMLDQDDDALMKMSMKDLATAFGILFDKAQLASGLSTENIAIHTKIDVNLSSEQALDELSKLRDAITQQNT